MNGGRTGELLTRAGKKEEVMERGGMNGQERAKTEKRSEEGTACRGMTATKRDTRMNERSDSCFSFLKSSAANVSATRQHGGIWLC